VADSTRSAGAATVHAGAMSPAAWREGYVAALEQVANDDRRHPTGHALRWLVERLADPPAAAAAAYVDRYGPF
jgi:hypothetical protein